MTQKNRRTSDLVVDVAVFYISRNEEDDQQMDINIATAVAEILGASKLKIKMAHGFCMQIIEASLDGLEVPGGEAAKKRAKDILDRNANDKLEALVFE